MSKTAPIVEIAAAELPHYESLIEAIRKILHETTETPLSFRDEGLFESAFTRPANLIAYTDGPVPPHELAASLAFGVAKNHALIDGNKRAAAISLVITLFLNGKRLDVSQMGLIDMFIAVASGEKSESDLADWCAEHVVSDRRYAG